MVLYRNAPNELDKLFTQPNSMQQNERSADDAAGSSVSMDQPKEQGVVAKPVAGPAVLVKGMQSFKVLTECPLVIMLLFQIYPFKFMEKNGPILLPAMLHVLMLNPPLFFASSPDSSENAASISLKLHDFFAAQVKTLSFITYLLRGSVDIIRQYCGPSNASVGSSGLRGGNIVASSVVNLLSKCPSESVVTRKELLLGIRHVLATDFRRELVEYIPKFVDEGFLLGFYNSSESKVHDPMSDVASLGSKATSHYGVPLMRRTSIGTTASTANVNDNVGPLDPAVTAAPTSAVASVILAANKYATLRPLTCSVYIDIVHYAKDSLSASQLVVIMETLCNHTHEESSVLPLNIQIACLKTISDLVEVMYNNQVSSFCTIMRFELFHFILLFVVYTGFHLGISRKYVHESALGVG